MSEPRDKPIPLLERFERFLDTIIPPPDEIAGLVRRGEALLGAGDQAGALRMADVALAAAPGYLRAVLLKADAHAARGAAYDALTVLDEASRERSLPSAGFARMAEFAASVGDDRRAMELEAQTRSRVRGQDRESALRLVAGARSLFARGAHAAGLRLARGATLIDPSLGGAWLLLADDALRRGDSAQARRTLDRALPALDPGDSLVNRSAGEIALALGDLGTAARHLRRAWIVGDEAAVAPLVVVLSRSGDLTGLEHVVADAEGSLARIARALVELSDGDAGARTLLEGVAGRDVPEALWPLALETTLKSAPEIADRWASEAPDRNGSSAVRSLGTATAKLAEGDAMGARDALTSALDDVRTAPRAKELYRDACRAAWRSQLAVMLEEIAVLVRSSPVLASLETELRTRRRELDDPLRVAILGEFSAGKSTFLNALVGATVSPMGVLPTTAYVHWLRFGDPGARIVDSRGGAVVATIDEAPRVVERKRDQSERVEYVEVTMPVARLARVELIDTPGFNAGDPAHEAAVRQAFVMADLALWLFDARQAGKLSETGPLREAQEAQLPVIGLLNKIDQVRESDRDKLLRVVRDGFRELAPLALALSSRDALAATLVLATDTAADDVKTAAREKLVSSGMASFLAYLDEHLVAQRAAWKQLRIARRVRDLLVSAEALMVSETAAHHAREEQRDALLEAIVALREKLSQTCTAVRREVGAVLREQLRGLEGRRRGDRGDDAKALATDAAAEIAYRARIRALDQLAPQLRAIESLAIATGTVGAESAVLVTAPVSLALEHAASEGVRDATIPSVSITIEMSDPLAAFEQAVVRRDDGDDDPHELLRIALEVARRELDGYLAPMLPEFRLRDEPRANESSASGSGTQ